ncbi:hypothetical protein BDV59DRAFT_20489 [Aspergillus ambiguus]|uniref:F-box protein n=1 Tax=Aspergillus ambiguus TaxID=176160 RepID=UPI003CCDAF52
MGLPDPPQTIAATLPIEITQAILSYLDVESYHAVRQTCCSWRSAASAPCMLRKILQQVPASVPSTTSSLTTEEWNAYFSQVARLNLLGYRDHVEKAVGPRVLPEDCDASSTLATTPDGRTTILLKGAQTTVYDNKTNRCTLEFPLASSLYPHWTSVCRALMETRNPSRLAVNQRYAKHRLAVSSTAAFVAIGLGRVIQIYGLRDTDDRSLPAEYVLGQSDMVFASTPGAEYEDTDGVVEALEFTDNDQLLRVAIGKETTIHRPTRVRYLGHPTTATHGPPPLDYWRKHLNHIYLDSAALAVTLTDDDEYRSTFRGLRLLARGYQPHSQHAGRRRHCAATEKAPPPFSAEDRFFIASLQTGHTDSYCIGQLHPTQGTVRIHRLFPSIYFRPGNSIPGARTEGPPRLYPPVPATEREQHRMSYSLCEVVSRWNAINLPSATFSAPLLAVSDDQRLLVVYEPGAGHSCCIVDGGSLYVYSMGDRSGPAVYQPASVLPLSPTLLSSTSASASGSGSDASESETETIYDRLQMTVANPFNDSRYEPPDIVPSWPFLLDRTSMDIETLHVSSVPGKGVARSYTVTGHSGGEVVRWQLRG